uniref:Uncharacterized protein n=1 Tax=Angiostrongylus cantonensis TaxID=6313 RepID=A0A0K0D272_ANGCA
MDVGKRGGARAFRGFFNGHSAKRISEFFPYYLYDKRGGGRAFVGGWQPYEGFGRRCSCQAAVDVHGLVEHRWSFPDNIMLLRWIFSHWYILGWTYGRYLRTFDSLD